MAKVKKAQRAAMQSVAADADTPVAKPREAVRAQRRPLALVLAVVLALLGATLAYVGLSQRGEEQALVVRSDVARGQVLEAGDFTTISVAKDTANVLGPDEVNNLVGRVATVDMPTGSLVTEASTATDLGVAEGTAVVGVGVTSAGIPGRALAAGDKVRIVYAPAEQDATAAPAAIQGTVQQTRTDGEQGTTYVDVAVEDTQAEAVARWSAAGRAAIVLDTADGYKGGRSTEQGPAETKP